MEEIDLSDMVITEVISSYRLSSPTGASSEVNKRKRWGFIFKYQGSTIYRCNGKEYLSDKYNPIILPEGSSYSWRCIEGGGYIVVEFFCSRKESRVYSFEIADYAPIMKHFLAIEKSRALHWHTAQLSGKRSLYGLLIFLLESQNTNYVPSVQYDKLKPAVEYMSEHYSDYDITNDVLAQLCNISTVYFRKTFSNVFNMPPMSYLKKLRIEKACEMLKSDYSSVTEIAKNVGYSNLYHFSKTFKEHTGFSPVNFHRQMLESGEQNII